MRSKNILSIVAFIAAFGLSAAFASLFVTKTQTAVPEYVPVNGYNSTSCFKYKNNSTTANKISALIRQDKRNERDSDREFYENGADIFSSSNSSAFSGYADAVKQYVDQSSRMKASDLPSDFQADWHAHMKAWRDYSNFLNRMKKSSNRAAVSREEIKEIETFHNREIERTWDKVLQTGVMHGANVY